MRSLRFALKRFAEGAQTGMERRVMRRSIPPFPKNGAHSSAHEPAIWSVRAL
jgi:hypothetical protein